MSFRCHRGWTGPTCEICAPLPGCSINYGYCTKPMECKCKDGYQGRFCNIVKCREVIHDIYALKNTIMQFNFHSILQSNVNDPTFIVRDVI